MGEERNTLTGHIQNYEFISGIQTHRTEIQTAKYDVRTCLFNSCFFFHLAHARINTQLHFKIAKPLYEEQSSLFYLSVTNPVL
jgi:hypothetical protein